MTDKNFPIDEWDEMWSDPKYQMYLRKQRRRLIEEQLRAAGEEYEYPQERDYGQDQ